VVGGGGTAARRATVVPPGGVALAALPTLLAGNECALEVLDALKAAEVDDRIRH
jgi:hypothetical protein